MGANMMPTMKKMGRTVFGVRMGLLSLSQPWPSSDLTFNVASCNILPCLQPLLPKRRVCLTVSSRCPRALGCCCSLGGRLLFVFFCGSLLGSWLDIESVCSTCCVCDMVGESIRGVPQRGRERRCCREWGWGLFVVGGRCSRGLAAWPGLRLRAAKFRPTATPAPPSVPFGPFPNSGFRLHTCEP